MFNIEILINEITTDWKDVLLELIQPYKNNINKILSDEYNKYSDDNIYPSKDNIFRCFNFFNIKDLQVIIVGQDPYQNKGFADGLSFSVSSNIKTPRSLNNIFKELYNSYNIERINNNLDDWSSQGVLMLNTSLTVIDSKSGSHMKIWKDFTYSILHWVANNLKHKISIMLWGNHAISYSKLFNNENFLILTHTHPSPLSRKIFVGNRHFILSNEFINKQIKWV